MAPPTETSKPYIPLQASNVLAKYFANFSIYTRLLVQSWKPLVENLKPLLAAHLPSRRMHTRVLEMMVAGYQQTREENKNEEAAKHALITRCSVGYN